MSRYNRYKILNNNSKYYRFLRKERNDLANIRHYETPILYQPDVIDRANLNTTTHIWAVGDRYYNLADQYYGDPKLWWIIAWYNGRPTESDCFPGDLLTIPLQAAAVLALLGIG
jgi:hypothetical protein